MFFIACSFRYVTNGWLVAAAAAAAIIISE
jgi:hypothetical protein